MSELTLKMLNKLKCNRGNVGTKMTDKQKLVMITIGEFFDLYCVSLGKKNLAALDYSSYGKAKYRKHHDIGLINEIIDNANDNGVKALHYKKRGGMYLKTIFYKEERKDDAYKLAYILWNDDCNVYGDSLQFMIGFLLGYSTANIRKFLQTRCGVIMTPDMYKEFRTELKDLKGYKKWINDNIRTKQIKLKDVIEFL